MTIKQFNKWLAFLILLAIILSACRLFSFGTEDTMYWKETAYTIDPDTILDSLAQGKKDVFTLQTATPEAELPPASEPVHWSQSDFYRIAQALHEYVWNESVEEWYLPDMEFGMDCQGAFDGPQYGRFVFYKFVHIREQESRIEHDIYILHQENTVRVFETEYYPRLETWQNIDWAKVKISVTDALQIAERNGGYEARSNENNECKISLALAPGSKYEGWQVMYTGNNRTRLFDIHINTLTGEYKIIK